MLRNQSIISSLIIGLSIVIAAIIFSIVLLRCSEIEGSAPAIMSEQQAADYLHCSTKDIEHILSKDEQRKMMSGTGISDIYSYLPYKKIGKQKIFLKSDLIKWVNYQSKPHSDGD